MTRRGERLGPERRLHCALIFSTMFYASAHGLRSETLSLHGRSLTYEISVTHPGMLVGYAVSIIIAAAIFAAYLALKCRRRKPIVEKGVLPVLAP